MAIEANIVEPNSRPCIKIIDNNAMIDMADASIQIGLSPRTT